jgi:hypothetical protein
MYVYYQGKAKNSCRNVDKVIKEKNKQIGDSFKLKNMTFIKNRSSILIRFFLWVNNRSIRIKVYLI